MNRRDTETPEELDARQFLEDGLKLKVTRVLEGENKSPDYLVDGDEPGYVVEVKSRFDDEDYSDLLKRGEVAVSERLIGHDRWGTDNARKALKQFRQVDPQHHRFWILWLSIRCEAGTDAMFSQAVGTLYGVKQVVYFDDASNAAHGRDCLYVVPGVFERWPEIDGAFVTMGESITFCANEFSGRAKALESSAIYQSFEKHGGPTTAARLEAENEFYALRDRSVDRKSEKAVCKHLAEKHGLKNVHILNMKTVTVTTLVPNPPATSK